MSIPERLLDHLRGERYGEVFLVFLDDPVHVDVYNSFTLNDCPEELWRALDPVALAREHGASFAILNGPRFWMMDAIGKVAPVEPIVADFGGVAMRRVATLEVGKDLVREPYHERHVNRGACWFFNAGQPVYELERPDGATYVLQAYCTGVDENLDQAALATLGQRLDLPDGWRYRARVLDEDLLVDTTERVAVVLQDELQNTYTLEG